MSELMIYAVALFTVALVLYTTGVWAERLARRLKPWHVVAFFFGVVVDTYATWLTYKSIGAIVITPHSVAGFVSLALMIVHFVWASLVLLRADEKAITNFHKLSVFVWAIWMTSYISGFVLGMQKLA